MLYDNTRQPALGTHFCVAFSLIVLVLFSRQWLYQDIAYTYCCLHESDNLDILPLKDFWRLLLPYDGGGARFPHWSTSGVALGEIIRRVSGNLHNANIVFLAVAMSAAYWCGLSLYKNLVPTVILTLLVGFGTHLNYAYYHNHVGIFHLYVAYVLLNIAFAYRLVFGETSRARDKIGFFLTLVLVMLFSEIWVNYFAFFLISILFLGCRSIKQNNPETRRRMKPIVASIIVLMVLYLPVRLSYGSHLATPGGEEELIFTYPYAILMFEDFLINIFTFLHASLTSFITPALTFSSSLVFVGAEEIVAQQNGYHPTGSHLLTPSHLFLWRFVAGGIAFAFFYLLLTNFVKSISTKEQIPVVIVLLCIMILVGFASHSIIKFRPYNSAPFLTYKCITSVLGVYLLTTAFFCYLNVVRSRIFFYGASIFLVIMILTNFVTRPYYENTAYNVTHLWYKKPYNDFSF